ncbi:hypothetical protein O4H61_16230 [Roseovarius aestuarii]|nr:hypothetical protein [Roseovarius aestuarii]
MAERHRSKDGKRDTQEIMGEVAEISHQGRSSGELDRRLATRDGEKRAMERPAGATRVRGADRRATGTVPSEDS